jgi:hypothetical protein
MTSEARVKAQTMNRCRLREIVKISNRHEFIRNTFRWWPEMATKRRMKASVVSSDQCNSGMRKR